jgi:hypothetical protein
MKRLARVAAAAVLVAATAAPAAGQSPDPIADDPLPGLDYDAVSTQWNGMARLIALARGLGLQVEATDRLDWEEVTSEDILFILYPVERVPPSSLAHFIRGGGRALLADDFGEGADAMGRLSILRDQPTAVDAARYHADRSFAPVAKPWMSSHPLAKGVDELVTNHPAILREVKGADVVFGFGAGEGVVAAGALGRDGRVVVISDPSIFINRMLQFAGNMQFAINTLRYLARPEQTRRLIILANDFVLYGEPPDDLDDGTVTGKIDQSINDFDNWLEERNDYLITREGLLAMSVALALLIALGAIVSIPLRRKGALDGAWTRAAEPSRQPGDFEELVAHYDRPGHRPSYSLPAAILRDTVNARLERLLDHPEPLHSLDEDALCARVRQQRGDRAEHALRDVYQRLRALPNRWQAASPWTVSYLSRRQFERLHADVEALERALGGN